MTVVHGKWPTRCASRSGRRKETRLLFLAWIVILLMLAGCFNPFAPRLTQDLEGTDLVITAQQTPQETLQNFKIAYTFKDSLLYSDLLDTGFVFVYFDPESGTSGRFVSWGREEDLVTTGRLFRHFQVIDLVWNETIYEALGENEGEICRGFGLSLVDMTRTYTVSGRAVFTFRKGGDGRWRIRRWKDESDL